MPLPTPTDTEEKTEFIARCMADPTMSEEFSDTAQRRAVCEAQWARGQSSDGD